MGHRFDPRILREYDIRGLVGRTLGPADAAALGRSVATHVRRVGGTRIVVGRDGRTSSPQLEAALIDGLTASGLDVVRIGLATTPMLYHAEAMLDVDAGIQVTGSHNPRDHNGFKIVVRNEPLFGDSIMALGRIAETGDWLDGTGSIAAADMLHPYVAQLIAGDAGGAFRIGWDAGNGAAGPAIEALVRALPGEHHTLFTAVDGDFPNHHPDPSDEANLATLKALVVENGLDFGVAFDGDGDRIGVIDGAGHVVPGDVLLALLAAPALRAQPGATIIGDVKTSQAVFDRIAALGGKPLMWKTGHAPMKAKMRETGATLGGEISGHIYFGAPTAYDDALLAAIRLIAAVRLDGGSLAAMVAALPGAFASPERRIRCPDDRKFAAIAEIVARLAASGAAVDLIDGARVTTARGWWLLRASNTEAALVARAEGDSPAALAGLLQDIDAQLASSGIGPVG